MRGSAGRVVEVGSGHAPDPRSHFLVDKDLNEGGEREGPLRRDGRPLVVALGEALPLRSGSVDLVVAHQVLEHAENPVAFLAECHRVGSCVEVETPSPLQELLFSDRSFHRWLFYWLDEEGVVVYWPLDLLEASGRGGEIFEMLYRSNGLVYSLVRGNREVFLTRWRVLRPPVLRRGSQVELHSTIDDLALRLARGGRVGHLMAHARAAGEVIQHRMRRLLRAAKAAP